MKIYADVAPRRARQIAADVAVVCWSVLWVWLGTLVHDTTMALAVPGEQLQRAGGSFRAGMDRAGDAVDDLPLLQDRVAQPLRGVGGVGIQIQDAGADLVSAVSRLATLLGWSTALTPIVLVGGVWLMLRVRFVRRSAAARRVLLEGGDLDLLALRALSRQPLRRVVAIHPRAGRAWREGDAATVRALAELELRSYGVLPPDAAEMTS